MRIWPASVTVLVLTGCMAPTPPVKHYASENAVSLRYSAYDSVPTLTAEAREMAIKHCEAYGKFANYQGGNALNAWTAEEIHRFSCDSSRNDDSRIIAGQSQRPSYIIIE